MSPPAWKDSLRRRFPSAWFKAVYFGWRLLLLSPWTETRFFKQVRALRPRAGTSAGSATSCRKVLFFVSRQDRDQVAMVTTLAWALQRRGHQTRVIGCDRALRHSCNYGNYPRLDPWVCRACELYARRTHELSGIETEWLGELQSEEERQRAEALVRDLAPDRYESFSYRGFHLGHIVRHSVAHFLRKGVIGADSESRQVYRNWLSSGVWLVNVCQELIRRHDPDVVVMLNGLFAPEWIMLETAKASGKRVVAWEVGFRPETFFFQHDAATDMCDGRNWPRFRDQPLTSAEDQRLDQYLAARETGGGYLLNYFPNLQASRQAICKEFAIQPGKKIGLLFPNITWDSTLFEKDVGFNGMGHWIEETIRIFASRRDAQLIIRVHPAEKVLPGADRDSVMSLIRTKFPQLPGNVIMVPPDSGASSYELMKLADCGLVYGSTTGLEMGVRGIPVIIAGQIYYGGLGLTIDAGHPASYGDAIDAVLSGRIAKNDPARTEAWRRYAYFAIFRSAIPLPQVCYQKAGDLPTLRYRQASDLDSGQDPNLDAVCQGITEGVPFLAASVT